MLVAPEVAELLGVPFVGGVRRFELDQKDGEWRAWRSANGELSGYMERFVATEPNQTEHRGELLFATVRGAGHMVPRFQPERATDLLRSFLAPPAVLV